MAPPIDADEGAQDKLVDAIRQVEEAHRAVTQKNQALENLSAKLSKYLSPELYRSIFSGEKSVEVASQRKKLTIFFSDIAGFTETTDLLESEELTLPSSGDYAADAADGRARVTCAAPPAATPARRGRFRGRRSSPSCAPRSSPSLRRGCPCGRCRSSGRRAIP